MTRLYVFDMDGVLWTMEDPLPYAAEVLQELRRRGALVHYLTNNSSRTRQDYVEKLIRLGMPATIDEVMTSAYATAQILRAEGAAGRKAFIIGEKGLREELEAAGVQVVDDVDAGRVDYVVVGWDRGFTYAKLAAAHRAVLEGAEFIATNRDATYPDAGGRTLPGGGTLVMALQTCTGVTPRTIGKPEPYTLDLILAKTGVDRAEAIIVGDRLDTDIAQGRRAGVTATLVLTGVTTREQAESAPPEQRPDSVLEDLRGLL